MKAIKNILIVSLPTIFILFILLEIFFRTVIRAADPPQYFYDENEKMYSFSNRKEKGLNTIGRFAEIRAKWHINNMRWNYPVDYYPKDGRNVLAVIGDSYIEALNVNVGESYPFLLGEKLKNDFEVYAFGVSGAPLSQYLHMSRYVNRHFNPDIIIFNIYHNDFDESIRELKPNYSHFLQVSITGPDSIKEIPPQPNHSFLQYRSWERIIYHSALFRYLYFNLKVQSLREKLKSPNNRFEANIDVDKVSRNKDLIIKSTNYLVKTIRQENSGRRVIFMMDAPRFSIYDNTLDKSNVMWLNNLMDTICTNNNIEFIDLTKYMKEAYSKNHVKFNYEIDGHWNQYGHKFVADVLYEYLRNNK